jgi:hypothetical protein
MACKIFGAVLAKIKRLAFRANFTGTLLILNSTSTQTEHCGIALKL